MTDSNDDLIARIAHRPGDEPPLPSTQALPVIHDWNSPIDTILADAMSARQIIRGEVADAKVRARRWDPGWPPDDWSTD